MAMQHVHSNGESTQTLAIYSNFLNTCVKIEAQITSTQH